MQCTNCRSTTFRPWEGELARGGFVVFAFGEQCTPCHDLVFSDAEVERQDNEIAMKLVEQGITTAREFRFVRKAAGLEAIDVANLLDVKPETISRWESGAVPLPRLAAFALGELFDRPQVTRRKLHA